MGSVIIVTHAVVRNAEKIPLPGAISIFNGTTVLNNHSNWLKRKFVN
jgi:hypothetical protein